jgi:hypothetical protein
MGGIVDISQPDFNLDIICGTEREREGEREKKE